MQKALNTDETGCCPRFDPQPWQEKEFNWKDKLFVKDSVKSFFHIPLNFGQVITKNMEIIEKAGAEMDNPLVLSVEKSLFGSEMYIAVSKNVPGAEMVKMSGSFLSKAYEGEYKEVGGWVKDMQEYVKGKGKYIKKMYFFYTTCPKCAKVYGKNYTVIFAEV